MKHLVVAVIIFAAISVTFADELGYSPDGGLVSFGEYDYVYDSASRLTEVWSNGVRVVENQYDALGRRVVKRTPEAVHTFVYDGWLLVVERIERSSGILEQIDYWWGKDISGTLDGAGGIGGLLYLAVSNSNSQLQLYVPLYDGHGNVMQYVDKQGTIVASYAYDAFGNTIRKSGVMADELKVRFSTKYSDDESGLYYFGRRFYAPRIARWLSRDPIEEDGGLNLYAYCGNNAVNGIDILGLVEYRGRSKENGFCYDFKVNKCEVAIIYGHGHESKPHKITFEDESSSSAYFWGCWPDTTNSAIPAGSRLVDEVGPHCTFYDNAVFEQLKTLREEAIQRAREICETRCCKNGVWVRFKFSPSDNAGVKILDWLKGNSSRNKPARLVGGGVWGGDVHVKCR